MREIDFVPAWYPRLRHRRQAVIVQGWLTVAALLLLALFTAKKQWDVRRAARAAANLKMQIDHSHGQLAQLDDLLQYQRQLRQQERVIARLGINVETTRLLSALEDAMPAQIAMSDLSVETDEQMRPTPANAVVPVSLANHPDKDPPMDRKLKIRLQGLAPSDMEVADLLARLSAIHFLDDINMSYARDRVEAGRIMREFEVTFSVNLNLYPEAR